MTLEHKFFYVWAIWNGACPASWLFLKMGFGLTEKLSLTLP